MAQEKLVICEISKKKVPLSDAMPVGIIRPTLLKLIHRKYPDIPQKGYISREKLKQFRQEYMEYALKAERGEISKLDREVIKSMVEHETIAKNIEKQFEKKATVGQRIADKVASFGGSWRFIITFGCILVAWIFVNVYVLVAHPFDPYPFILLNLVLSCLAALQAPVIMMSQNRKEEKDRLRSENDYKVNLKAEMEIRTLHEKIDNLMKHQWQRLLEIQELQLDLMEDARDAKKTSARRPKRNKKNSRKE